MRDVLPEIVKWKTDGKHVALATVIKVWGSAPRPIGAKMAISSAGDMAGSVSGGCVESAVFEEAQEVLRTGRSMLIGYGVTDEQAWSVGLSCGGEIEIFIEPVGS
jgi:xanthine/CO dehydrogenase XdhC/CoxF family maturation factor